MPDDITITHDDFDPVLDTWERDEANLASAERDFAIVMAQEGAP